MSQRERRIDNVSDPIARARKELGLTNELIRDSEDVNLYTAGLQGADDSQICGMSGNFKEERKKQKSFWSLRVDHSDEDGFHVNAEKVVSKNGMEISRDKLLVTPTKSSEEEQKKFFDAHTKHLTEWTGYDHREEFIKRGWTTESAQRRFFAQRVQRLWGNVPT